MNNIITIIVGTCDNYSHLWKDFVYLFNKYWDHSIEVEKYFITETVIDKNLDGFHFIANGKIPYSNCLINTLDKITTPYVLWMQDDYFLRKTISKELFQSYLKFVQDNNVDRFGISEDSRYYTKHHVRDNFFKIDQNSKYSLSMQSSIWNTEFFKSCLIPNENPWMFEINGTKRLNKREHNIFIAIQDLPWYLQASKKGKYTDWYYKIKKEEGL